jgi:hypothetical protein
MNPSESYKTWQETWQQPAMPADAGALDALLHRLGNYEDHMKKRNRAKLAAIILVFSAMLAQLWLRPLPRYPWPLFAGLGLAIAATAGFIAFYLRVQFRLAAVDFGVPALEFVRRIIAALEHERRLFQVHFPAFLLVMILAVNVMAVGVWPAHPWHSLLWLHVKISLALALVGAGSWLYRRALFRRKAGPLLGEMRETEASWKRGEGR